MVGSPQQPFPQLNTPLVDPGNMLIAIPWYRLLVTLWQRSGGATAVTPLSVSLQANPDNPDELQVFDVQGNEIGLLSLSAALGLPAVPVPMPASPQNYVAPDKGTVVVFGGAVALSRDSGKTFFNVSLQGGAVPVLPNDQLQITWYGDAPPQVTFFPG